MPLAQRAAGSVDARAHEAGLLLELASLRAQRAALERELAQLHARLGDAPPCAEIPACPLQAQESRLATILDQMPGAVAYWDAGLTLRYCNRYLRQHWANKPQPLVGRTLAELLSPRALALSQAHLRAALQGQLSVGEHLAAGGRTARVSYSPDLEDGVVKGVIVLAVDVSELLAAQAAAERASRVKSDFLATMTHELRTPLNAVLGFAQVGALQFAGQDAETHFHHILGGGQRLLGLVNDVLDLSQMDTGRLTLQADEWRLEDLLDRVVGRVREAAHGKGLALRLTRDAQLHVRWRGDALRVEQVLYKLLHNAVVYTAQGSVSLSARADAQGLHVRVQDTGPGLPAAVQASLFQPFEGSGRGAGGSGLGLSICKRLVDLMGGRIAVDSRAGEGVCVDVVLPLTPVDEGPVPALAPAVSGGHLGPALTGLRVLVAEDHPVNQLLLEQFLHNHGAQVSHVGNGRAAVQAVQAAGPGGFDAVLCDVEMPELDGYQATEAMLLIDPGLPVVGLTAHAFEQARQRGFAAGMVAYVTKPFMFDDLGELLRRVARRPRG